VRVSAIILAELLEPEVKPSAEVTIELLATALIGLDQIVNRGSSEQAPDEMLSRRLAAEALAAVAVTLKYLLAREGQAMLPGFGTFSVAEGGTVFSPAEDLADYVALAEGDESRRVRGLVTTTVSHLQAALALLPHLQDHLDEPVTVSTSNAQRTLQRVFGDAPDLSVRIALTACADRIRAAVKQSEYSESLQIPLDAIRDIIGPGGKMIRSIIERTGARIDVEDDGRVNVESADENSVKKAIGILKELSARPELNKIYLGKVQRITDFGAFVEIMPGRDGLLHVSEIAPYRIKDVRDELKEGDQVMVKVISIDPSGKIRLSHKALLSEDTEARADAARDEL
jgi:predicted RNA-binding protein with RPS1 domain